MRSNLLTSPCISGVYIDGKVGCSMELDAGMLDLDEAGSTKLIWAPGDTWDAATMTATNEHSLRSGRSFEVNFKQGTALASSGVHPLIVAHGVCMAISWLLLVPTAALLAIFRADVGYVKAAATQYCVCARARARVSVSVCVLDTCGYFARSKSFYWNYLILEFPALSLREKERARAREREREGEGERMRGGKD